MKGHRGFENGEGRIDEASIDELIRREFSSMKKIAAPASAVDSLYRRIGQRATRSRRGIWNPLLFLRFRMEVVFAVLLTLAISVPLTFLLTKSRVETGAGKTYVVRFVYENSSAETVQLTGDFNNWRTLGMNRIGETPYWSTEIELSEGIYKYSFLIDSKVWTADPLSPLKVRDSYGNETSLIVLVDEGEEDANL
jgi:hypothetical protein